jgi:hypothetical protein
MKNVFAFEGKIVSIVWGGKDYAVLPFPTEMGEALVAGDVTHVSGTLAEYSVTLPVTHAPAIDAVFLFTDAKLLAAAKLSVGDKVVVDLRPADEAIA